MSDILMHKGWCQSAREKLAVIVIMIILLLDDSTLFLKQPLIHR